MPAKKEPRELRLTQPLITKRGTIRFKPNKAICYLYDSACVGRKVTLAELVSKDFAIEDMEQFYQLTGMSLTGFRGLKRIRKALVELADEQAEAMRGTEEEETEVEEQKGDGI